MKASYVVLLFAVPTCLDYSRPAFFDFAVTNPTMRLAGHDLGANHHVRAAGNKALAWTTAMFGTETLANSGGGAVRHGARLLLASAVSVAM